MLGEGKGGQKQQWPDVKEAAVVLQWSRSFRRGGGALRWVPAGGGWQKLEPGLGAFTAGRGVGTRPRPASARTQWGGRGPRIGGSGMPVMHQMGAFRCRRCAPDLHSRERPPDPVRGRRIRFGPRLISRVNLSLWSGCGPFFLAFFVNMPPMAFAAPFMALIAGVCVLAVGCVAIFNSAYLQSVLTNFVIIFDDFLWRFDVIS